MQFGLIDQEGGMALLLLICEGLSGLVSTIWDLQEMRFAAVFEDVSFLALTVVLAALSCFIATRRS
ncbi:hypothetical protein RchiOBHm_Chr6g0252811 [Rosa chinensis]|uniref:Uncharacterized protein n=1 Tax=Rosa chinensis TaxID=74649 RepID=A0A2P6PL57_ROSCH|nr:hypothetical protein RchiOBHm_Chr6g0252811 [Rosa chinensis]